MKPLALSAGALLVIISASSAIAQQDGISKLTTITQQKTETANDEAVSSSERQRDAVQGQKLPTVNIDPNTVERARPNIIPPSRLRPIRPELRPLPPPPSQPDPAEMVSYCWNPQSTTGFSGSGQCATPATAPIPGVCVVTDPAHPSYLYAVDCGAISASSE